MSDLVRREDVLALAEALLSTSGEKERLVRLLAALPAPDPRAEKAVRLAEAVEEFKRHAVLRGGKAREREEQYRAEDDLTAALAAWREEER